MRDQNLYDLNLYYQSHEEHVYRDLNGEEKRELLISYEISRKVPDKIALFKDPFFLFCKDSTLRIRLPILEGEMKMFFDNYKDYYYLPDEDMCVLKTVAASVDKEHKENAKKETCYIRYRGFFIPQFDQDAPSFRKSYKDRFCYRKYCPEEITEEFCELIGETVLSFLNA